MARRPNLAWEVVKGALPESTLGESLVDCRDPLQYFRAKMFGITR